MLPLGNGIEETLKQGDGGCQDFMPGVVCSGEREVESTEQPHVLTHAVLKINTFPSVTRTVNAI